MIRWGHVSLLVYLAEIEAWFCAELPVESLGKMAQAAIANRV